MGQQTRRGRKLGGTLTNKASRLPFLHCQSSSSSHTATTSIIYLMAEKTVRMERERELFTAQAWPVVLFVVVGYLVSAWHASTGFWLARCITLVYPVLTCQAVVSAETRQQIELVKTLPLPVGKALYLWADV